MMYSFPSLEPVCFSMSTSNCCFLTCIQISQDAGKVGWYSHLFKNFPQFVVIHTVKSFGVVNKSEVDVFLNSLAFLMIQWMLATLSLVLLPFLTLAWTSGNFQFTYCWREPTKMSLNSESLERLEMENDNDDTGWSGRGWQGHLSKLL